MKKKTGFIAVTLIVAAAIGGQISGNQPQRDAVTAAEKQFGVILESRMLSWQALQTASR